jgi:hypothetical protein
MAKMFEKTSKSVKMIVGSLEGSVSDQDNYMDNLTACVEKNIPFEIIFLDVTGPNKESKAYKFLRAKQADNKNIVMKLASDEVRKRLVKHDVPIHYSVFDDNKYRYEKNTKRFLALVCFNDTKNAATLTTIFNGCFAKSALI